ncbi:hypothetical protein NUSPORA_02692 [Nucleospora cyclopteri]
MHKVDVRHLYEKVNLVYKAPSFLHCKHCEKITEVAKKSLFTKIKQEVLAKKVKYKCSDCKNEYNVIKEKISIKEKYYCFICSVKRIANSLAFKTKNICKKVIK